MDALAGHSTMRSTPRASKRHVGVVVPTSAVAVLLVSSSRYVGLIPQRLAEQHGQALGVWVLRAFRRIRLIWADVGYVGKLAA